MLRIKHYVLTRPKTLAVCALIAGIAAAGLGESRAQTIDNQVTNSEATDIKSLIKHARRTGDTSQAPKIIFYRFVLSIESIEVEDEQSKTFSARYQVDPSQPKGARLTRLSGDEPSLDDMTGSDILALEGKSDSELAEDFWCSNINDFFAEDTEGKMSQDDFEVISDDAQEAVLRANIYDIGELVDLAGPPERARPDATSKADKNEEKDKPQMKEGKPPKKMLKRMFLQLTLRKPDLALRQMRVWLSRPTRMMMIANMKKLDIQIDCQLTPNGSYYIAKNSSKVEVSAMGKNMIRESTITISDLQPIP